MSKFHPLEDVIPDTARHNREHLYQPKLYFCVFSSEIRRKSVTLILCGDFNFTNPSNCQSLEVADRGSETQLQVTENCN